MTKNIRLFLLFAKIGLFTLGGGYAMLPLMERELVGILSNEDFLDVTAVAQSAPGIMAINVAILTGQRVGGLAGAVCAACGAALPSFIIILLIALFFRQFAENPLVQRIFTGVRPAVTALIMVPVFHLAKTAGVTIKTVWICLAAALAVWLCHISPVWVVLAGVAGGLAYQWARRSIR